MIATCARIREILPAYIEKEAGPAETLQAASHIASCTGCADEARRGAVVLDFLRPGKSAASRRNAAAGDTAAGDVAAGDLAAGVVAALKRMKPRTTDRRALKWSAIGLFGALMAADLTRPRPLLGAPLRALQRAGDVFDLDLIAGRVLDSMAGFLPSPSSLVDMAGGAAGPALAGPHLTPGVAIALVFLGAALVTAVFAGSLLAGCVFLSRAGAHPARRLFKFF